ncbi:MAG: hypothetical protein EBU49_06150 [Proteobacteria bacterium]|nr:hypothetical protein [Pseudomonadota bacterium]
MARLVSAKRSTRNGRSLQRKCPKAAFLWRQTPALVENLGPSEPKITISSVRGGGVFGEHEIRFMGIHDEIIITHRAYSRSLFAEGALDLAIWQHKCGSKFKSKLISLSDFAGGSRA